VGDTEMDLCDDYHRPLPAESVSQHTFGSARSFETPMVSITTIVLVMLAAVLVVAIAVCAVIGAGLFRVGLHLKSESQANTRR
jgi:hypothetical protein